MRTVTTAYGATAVQVVVEDGRRNRVLEHLGSEHSDTELAALTHLGRKRLHVGRAQLDLEPTSAAAPEAGALAIQERHSRVPPGRPRGGMAPAGVRGRR